MRRIALALLLCALCMMMTVSLAQISEEPCSSRESVYPIVKTAILDLASQTGVRVRYAAIGERLDIISSKHAGPWCWLEVEDGWLIDSVRALSSEPRDTATAQANDSARSCYRADTAYITGNMNIRMEPTTDSSVVERARAGDDFAVTQSRQGADWCWLKVSVGWLANTSRVRSTKPDFLVTVSTVTTQESLPADIDNCCFVDRKCKTEHEWKDGYWAFQKNRCGSPTNVSVQPATPGRPQIVGSPAFIRFVQATLDLLEARSTRWYRYVVDQTSVIVEGDPWGPGICGAHVRTSERLVTVDTDCQTWGTTDLAPILVHEACHVYHHDNGIIYPEGHLREEWECGKPSVAAHTALGASGVRHMPWDEFFEWINTNPFG